MAPGDQAPEQKHRVDIVMDRVRQGQMSMESIKDQVDTMETTDRGLLRNQLNVELSLLRQKTAPEDVDLVRRLNDLDDHLKDAEKSFGTKAQEGIGAGINTVIDTGAAGLKIGTEFVGNQVRKGTDAVVQIGAQVADIIADPNRSKKEKMIHVAGLAAIVAVPAVLLYKLFSKMSGRGLPEGQKPGWGRTILKWTGFAFIGSLGVRALAPMVVEQQKKLSTPESSPSVAATTPLAQGEKAPTAQPENPAEKRQETTASAPDTILSQAIIDRQFVQVVEGSRGKRLKVGGKPFLLRAEGQRENLMDSLSTCEFRNGKLVLTSDQGTVEVQEEELKSINGKLAGATKAVTLPVKGWAGFGMIPYTLSIEFTPETSA